MSAMSRLHHEVSDVTEEFIDYLHRTFTAESVQRIMDSPVLAEEELYVFLDGWHTLDNQVARTIYLDPSTVLARVGA